MSDQQGTTRTSASGNVWELAPAGAAHRTSTVPTARRRCRTLPTSKMAGRDPGAAGRHRQGAAAGQAAAGRRPSNAGCRRPALGGQAHPQGPAAVVAHRTRGR